MIQVTKLCLSKNEAHPFLNGIIIIRWGLPTTKYFSRKLPAAENKYSANPQTFTFN